LAGTLADLPPEEMERRFALADSRIRKGALTHQRQDDIGEQQWSLGCLPLLIEEQEWNTIAAGVKQRAELLDRVFKDFYGEGQLVLDGVLPAAALAGSTEYLRPLVGAVPQGGRLLHLYAADLGRGPDGQWWVLQDRTQAPSGVGYALQNRLVLSHAFPTQYAGLNVERLAPFFSAFREGLKAAAHRSEPRIGLLTPGPYSETYAEQVYLARYLGFLLVEGDDLTVRDGRVHVRTIAGLKRMDVLWRRLDSDFADPLELNAGSRLGVAGLVNAIRNRSIVVANMLGSGLVESPALMSFLPALCQALLGEDLKLPNIATWWCGQERESTDVLDRFDDLAIRGAHGELLPDFPGQSVVLGSELAPSDRSRLVDRIRTRGIDYVGQEVVRLSTTPVWDNGALVPRPFVLRVFAAATQDGWRIMPGGFCRVASRPDDRAVSMAEGARSADVWVLGERPVEVSSLLPASSNVQIRRVAGHLPSRAADNLFWLGRYLERIEATVRIVRALSTSLTETGTPSAHNRTILRLQHLLVTWAASTSGDANAMAADALLSRQNSGSACSLSGAVQRAARSLRERLSPEVWQLIIELEVLLRGLEPDAADSEDVVECAERTLRIIAALSGLVQENMNRAAGWHFVEMGRRIERAINTCRFAGELADQDAGMDDLDVLLDLVDSQITYRSRYLVGLSLAPVRDMVVLDPYNPRSVAFQVKALDQHLAELPSLRQDGIAEAPRRIAIGLAASLTTADAVHLDSKALLAMEQNLLDLANAIAGRYFPFGPNAARPEKLTGLA
jgi:uncharacterized circularly permuted ATP-grasp superfamily protein/uncharacterized alpha-E superfamily protein